MKVIKLKEASYNFANYSCGHIHAVWGCEFDGVVKYQLRCSGSHRWKLRHYDPDSHNGHGEFIGEYQSKAQAIEAARSIRGK